MMRSIRMLVAAGGLGCLAMLAGCQSDGGANGAAGADATAPSQALRDRHSLYDKPGYVTFIANGQLWIFEEGSDAVSRFVQDGPPSGSVTIVDAGPHQMDLRAVNRAVIDGYMAR